MIPAPPPGRPLSVRIGRIVVRLLLLGLIIWGLIYAYQAYVQHQRAQEIAPVHGFAQRVLIAFQKEDYFAVQKHLDPVMQHEVGIDTLAEFAQKAELNTTRNGHWKDWNRTQEANTTVYHMNGMLVLSGNPKQVMQWEIRKEGEAMTLQRFAVGKHVLRIEERNQFP